MKVDCSLTCDCTFASGCKFEAEQAAARAAKPEPPQNLQYPKIIVRKRSAGTGRKRIRELVKAQIEQSDDAPARNRSIRTPGPLRQMARDLRNERIERGDKYYANKERS